MSPPPLSRTEQNFVTVISHLKYKFLNGFRGYPLPSPLPHACLLHFYSTSVTCSHLRLHLSCSTAKRVALPFSVSFIWNDLNCVTGCLQVNKKWNSNIKSYFNEIVVHCVKVLTLYFLSLNDWKVKYPQPTIGIISPQKHLQKKNIHQNVNHLTSRNERKQHF